MWYGFKASGRQFYKVDQNEAFHIQELSEATWKPSCESLRVAEVLPMANCKHMGIVILLRSAWDLLLRHTLF